MQFIYTLDYYSALKAKENYDICYNMDESWEHYAKQIKLYKEKYLMNSTEKQ